MAETKKKAAKPAEAEAIETPVEETKAAPKATKKAPAKKPAAKKPAAEKAAAPKAAAPKASKKEEAGLSSAPRASKKAKEEAVVEAPAKPAVHEARCVARGVRVAPRKVRLVADLVRGKDVDEALGLLKAVNRAASEPVYKAIKSAASNATNNFGLDYDSLYVAEIQVGDAFRIKRYIPRAKGSASSIIKRNSNIRVIVKERI